MTDQIRIDFLMSMLGSWWDFGGNLRAKKIVIPYFITVHAWLKALLNNIEMILYSGHKILELKASDWLLKRASVWNFSKSWFYDRLKATLDEITYQ